MSWEPYLAPKCLAFLSSGRMKKVGPPAGARLRIPTVARHRTGRPRQNKRPRPVLHRKNCAWPRYFPGKGTVGIRTSILHPSIPVCQDSGEQYRVPDRLAITTALMSVVLALFGIGSRIPLAWVNPHRGT